MASAHWRTGHTVETLLSKPDVGWNYLQLVRLLLRIADTQPEQHKQSKVDIDESLLIQLQKSVRFKSSLSWDFAPSYVREVSYSNTAQQTIITNAHDALASVSGPLPETFISWIKDLAYHGDHAMADFFDLFNNRLQSIRYLVCRSTRPALSDTSVNKSESGRFISALLGDAEAVQVSQGERYLAGLFSSCRMSLPVARQLLDYSMNLKLVSMGSLKGGWLHIARDDRQCLGHKKTSVLGLNTTLGKRIWDQQLGVELVLGPVTLAQAYTLIPGGTHHRQLQQTIATITESRVECHIVLLCPFPDIPLSHLSNKKTKLQLGQTSVLRTTLKANPNSQPIKIRFTLGKVETRL